ncbi:MAG: metallopeptidase family protein [Myxococcota bacterium]|nr:metallopeptidase family protein [Myxococcota bacterium]
MSRWWWCAVLVGLGGCKQQPSAEPSAPASVQRLPEEVRAPAPTSSRLERQQPLAVCRSEGLDALSAARGFYDREQFEDALSCAAQASAFDPDDPLAHSERGAALAALNQLPGAQLAYARALALNPDLPDALLGAAYLYGVRMPSSRENDELAVVYAERGFQQAEQNRDRELSAEFALMSAMAFNDVGASREALARAEGVLTRQPKSPEAAYERAVALFELCRFAEAKQAFGAMLQLPDRSAHAHHHLGLLQEREGDWKGAEAHFAQARKLAPDSFGVPPLLSEVAFRAEVQKAVATLPRDMRRDLQGVPVRAEELPSEADLLSGDPPLSPAILGLYRGPPLGESCDGGEQPCRSVAVYRRNLARAVRTRAELIEQIRITLLHEVGHLRGEDDHELAARGLE